MANGGWHGTADEWSRAELPLRAIDPALEAFSSAKDFQLSRNAKDWPERSLIKNMPLRSLLQIFCSDLDAQRWKVWVVVSEDRGPSRFWKQEMLAEDIASDELVQGLQGFLDEGLQRLIDWNAHPAQLELATHLPVG